MAAAFRGKRFKGIDVTRVLHAGKLGPPRRPALGHGERVTEVRVVETLQHRSEPSRALGVPAPGVVAIVGEGRDQHRPRRWFHVFHSGTSTGAARKRPPAFVGCAVVGYGQAHLHRPYGAPNLSPWMS